MQHFELAHFNISLNYELLELMKGLVLQIQSWGISMAMGPRSERTGETKLEARVGLRWVQAQINSS